MSPPVVYVLIGVQGSGKSTWARAHAGQLDAAILASDDVRNELEAQGVDPTPEGDLVFRIVEARLAERLEAGRNVIVDATHARIRWREKEVAIAREHKAKVIAVWFDVPVKVCLERNAQRPGGPWGARVVPRGNVLGVARGFEPPRPGEFDEVWRLTTLDD